MLDTTVLGRELQDVLGQPHPAVREDADAPWHVPGCEEVDLDARHESGAVALHHLALATAWCCDEDIETPERTLLHEITNLERLCDPSNLVSEIGEESPDRLALSAVLVAEPRLGALEHQVLAGIAQREALATEWLTEHGDQALDLAASLVGTVRYGAADLRPFVMGWRGLPATPDELQELTRTPGPLGAAAASLLVRHAARKRKPGRLLAVNRYDGALPGGRGYLELAWSRYAAGDAALLVPRSLEPLLTDSSWFTTAVVRESDSDAVLETALRLVSDGAGTPAHALKLARALA
jgi:hypothetical protein